MMPGVLLFLDGFFFLFALFVFGMIGLAIWQLLGDRRRSRELEALAARNGWRYIAKDRHVRPDQFRGLRPFGQGGARMARNILGGTKDGVPFEVFDYQYTVSSGKHSQTYHHKVVVIEMPISAPGLSIERERLHHKIFDAMGGEDIDFESDAFSRRYWVRCPDRRFAYDVIHPRMIEYLMAQRDLHWQWRSRALLLHDKGRLRTNDVQPLLDLVLGFHALVPRHLVRNVPAPGDGNLVRNS